MNLPENSAVTTVAALFVERGGCYWDLPGVDPWDEERDARLYAGPWPVIAHPPCARWSKLAGLVEARYGYRRGEDGDCFAAALRSVRTFGGVLEHPEGSAAWRVFDLPRPLSNGWIRGLCGGWACSVAQSAYGHRALKRTWLYYFGHALPPVLDWRRPQGTARVSEAHGNERRSCERMGYRERVATPKAFRDLLIEIARSCARS